MKASNDIEFHRLISSVQQFCEGSIEPEQALPELLALSRRATNDSRDGMDHIILALACLEVINRSPAAHLWSRLWSLVWHDATLALDLPQLAIMFAREDAAFRDKLLHVASDIVDRAVLNPGWRAFQRETEHFPALGEYWKSNAKLINLWWGLREARATDFRADEGMMRITAAIDSNVFMKFLERFENPYPLPYALRAGGAEWSFSIWKELLANAPSAFDANGKWNGSAIAPLLLGIALQKIAEAQAGLRPDAGDAAIRDVALEIENLAGEVAKVIAARPDGGACAERWSAWLMRQCLTGLFKEPLPFPADAKSRGYVGWALLAALGRCGSDHTWNSSVAPDAEPWEHWAYRCVLVALSADGHAEMPKTDDFLERWRLSPEEWAASRGQLLRASASLFEVFGDRSDSYGTRLLAIPLAEAGAPYEIWNRLWDDTQIIRDIVEFGDPEEILGGGIGSQNDACQMMRLVFGLGLMMLDCVVDPDRKIAGDRRAALEALFAPLVAAVAEMSLIDRFDVSYWRDAFRHVAVRRAIWSEGADKVAATFSKEAKPSFADLVQVLARDTENLFALIEVALRNNVEQKALRRALEEASVDLADEIAFADHLGTLSEKRAAFSTQQIAAARSLISIEDPVT